MYDPNLMGTPIPMLQIPESVMTQITTDMSSGRESSKFTQDGKTFQQLVAVLPLRDFQCAGSTDSEVVLFFLAFPLTFSAFSQIPKISNFIDLK